MWKRHLAVLARFPLFATCSQDTDVVTSIGCGCSRRLGTDVVGYDRDEVWGCDGRLKWAEGDSGVGEGEEEEKVEADDGDSLLKHTCRG